MTSMSERLANLPPDKLALLKKAMGNSRGMSEPIAVVGMECRFAGTSSVGEYWNVITNGIDNTSEIPKSRWELDEFYDAKGGTPGKMTTRWGGFLDDIDRFDAAFFGISPREAEKMDPQHRLLLEVVWEALESGGLAPSRLRESATGVFIGIGGVDYSRIPVQLDNYYQQITAYSGTGNALSIAANRISYTLDLRGPSLSIDTACSSSLVAAHLAVRSLRSHECDMAIVGGVNAILTPETTLAFSQAQMLSADGKCRPFDHRANGYVRGEGCGAIILKRLSDATSDHDNILAVIRGSAVNQDGLTSGITAPRATAQSAVIRRALKDAGLRSADVSYVEAHGTATPLGDPIEASALTEVFRKSNTAHGAIGDNSNPCYFGSVKANIGHTETAAGMASLIKTILMLRHQLIPRQLHFQRLNPHVRLDDSRLHVADRQIPWSTGGRPRIAGVSSFGFGGTNSHVVLEEFTAKAVEKPLADRPKHVLTLSAKNPDRLQELVGRYHQSLNQASAPGALSDICYTAATGRSHFHHRMAIVAENTKELSSRLDDLLSGANSGFIAKGKTRGDRRFKVAFLFPGQGSQFPHMGRDLYRTHPVFRAAIDRCDAGLKDLLPHRLLHVLFEDDTHQRHNSGEGQTSGNTSHNSKPQPKIHDTLYTQPALFAVQYALAQLWRSFGIQPSVVAGHSVGDYVAACDAGVFSLEDALYLIAHRARLVSGLPRDGLMAAVMAPHQQVAQWIEPYRDDVNVAVHNGLQNTVISGRTEVVSQLLELFAGNGVQSKILEVSHAMHSPLLGPILDDFQEIASSVQFSPPRSPWISSSEGQVADQRVCSAKYWRNHLRNTVRFVESARTLQSLAIDAAIEIGPGTTLCSLVRRIWGDTSTLLLPSLRSAQPDWDVMLQSLAQMYAGGANIDWKAFDQPYRRTRIFLPTYPFERQSHWYDMSRKVVRGTATSPPSNASPSRMLHPLLGNRLPMAGDKIIFEAVLGTSSPAFLIDHRVDQNAVFPAAGYVEQGLAAAHELFGPGNHSVTDLCIQQALVFTDNQTRVVQIQVGPDQRGERTFDIFSRTATVTNGDKTTWMHHATGLLRQQTEASSAAKASPPALNVEGTSGRLPNSIEPVKFYQGMSSVGLQYGPNFTVLDFVKAGQDECLARVSVPDTVASELASYVLHPSILDGCLQSMAGAINATNRSNKDHTRTKNQDLLLPTLVQNTRVLGQFDGQPLWVHTKLRNEKNVADSYTADIGLYDADGQCVAVISGARVQRIAKHHGKRASNDLVYTTQWIEQPLPPESTSAAKKNGKRINTIWLVFAGHGSSHSKSAGQALAAELVRRGDHVYLAYDGQGFAEIDDARLAGVRAAYRLHPTCLLDYERLLDAITEHNHAPLGVIDCRAVSLHSADANPQDALERNSIAQATASNAGRLLMTLRALAKTKVAEISQTWLVTNYAQQAQLQDPVAPEQTALWGMGRCAMLEMPHLSLHMADVDFKVAGEDRTPSTQACVTALASELHFQLPGNGDSEDHLAFRGDKRLVGRLQQSNQLTEAGSKTTQLEVPRGRFQLRANAAGGIEGLHYAPVNPRELGPHDVEIEIGCAGLNFSDVLKAMGLYPGVKDEIVPLGIECAGVVTNLGNAVVDFKRGQRVMGVAPYSFASHAITADYAIVATPDNLSDEAAATIPITFLTAYHALVNLARLAPGERLLIHAGAGGVGQAAIQIAKQIGAEVFTTAGSEEKRQFLRSLGVDHIFDSRTLDFAQQITNITEGLGVDVVLNSLPGEAITKSLSILSAYGRFLEIGKTDIYQNRKIGLWPFQDNLSYFAIDLDRMLRQRPDEIKGLYADVMPMFASGSYQALPLKSFSPRNAVDAYRYMAQRRNIGKVVVSFATKDPAPDNINDSSGSILITGGLGALGQQVARWAVERGARHLVILTRRSPETTQQQFTELSQEDVNVTLIQGDVADVESLRKALASIPGSFPPVRGVIHAAGVLRDGLLQTMEMEQLETALAPKVQGAWNLHRLLPAPLDYFVMFSSVAGTIGSPGQGNYAAGNAFMDGLAARLRSLGTPAVSIAWGPWGAAGMAASEDIRKQLAERGMRPLDPQLAIQLMDAAITQANKNVTIADADWATLLSKLPNNGTRFLSEFRSQVLIEDTVQRRPRDEQLLKQLDAAQPDQRQSILQQVIASSLGDVMGIEAASIDTDHPLASLGLDSLMGMELRTSLESKLGFEMPMTALIDDPSVASLAAVADQILSESTAKSRTFAGPETSDGANRVAASTPETISVADNAKRRQLDAPNHRSDLVTLGGLPSRHSPLFCVHPVGGDLRCYDKFARAMRNRLVYGLRAHGLQAGTRPHTTLDRMIEHYIAAIRNQQPEGPYCLMGWSTGGIFAYEIVRRLLDLGHEVTPLIMVDTPRPFVFKKVDLNDNAKFLVDLIEFANYFAGTKMQVSYDQLQGQSENASLASVLELAIEHNVLPAQTNLAHLKRLIDVCRWHVQFLQTYSPTELSHVAHLIRPEDTSILSEAARLEHSDDFGWNKLVNLKLHRVPGHHFTMMTGKNAEGIATVIEGLLSEADPHVSTSGAGLLGPKQESTSGRRK